jgi:purine-binding chemotaxis protein CheW
MSLLFRVCARLCALPLAHVVETMRPLPIEPMTGAPSCVRGLAIVRGAPLPVVDLAELLHEEARPASDRPPESSARFVTVKVAGRAIALAVDAVVGVRALARERFGDLPPLLENVRTEGIASIGILDAELLLVLRSARLVPPGLPTAAGPP